MCIICNVDFKEFFNLNIRNCLIKVCVCGGEGGYIIYIYIFFFYLLKLRINSMKLYFKCEFNKIIYVYSICIIFVGKKEVKFIYIVIDLFIIIGRF